MKELIGKRIRLTSSMLNDPFPIPVGSEGVVDYVSELKMGGCHEWQISVKWDSGRGLMLIWPIDHFQVID